MHRRIVEKAPESRPKYFKGMCVPQNVSLVRFIIRLTDLVYFLGKIPPFQTLSNGENGVRYLKCYISSRA